MENERCLSDIDKSKRVISHVSFQTLTGEITGNRYCGSIKYTYTVSIPQFANIDEYALIITFDGLNASAAQVMANHYEEGIAPPCIVIGVSRGLLSSSLDGGYEFNARQYSYDVYAPYFANFLVEELLPAVISRHKLKIMSSPDMHMVIGGSSGGMCAWNCVWFSQKKERSNQIDFLSPTITEHGVELCSFLLTQSACRVHIHSGEGVLWGGGNQFFIICLLCRKTVLL